MRSPPYKLIFLVFIFVLCLSSFVKATDKSRLKEEAEDKSWLEEEEEGLPSVPTVTNAFFETDIREVLRDISAQTGVKIVPDETVQGTISMELKKVPVEEALRLVLSIGNYTFRKMPEGYYLVGLCTPTSPSFNQLSITEYFQPSYLKAKELQSLISDFYRPYTQTNEDVNTITITAAPEVVKRIQEDLAIFDRAPRQVMIEALVIEISAEDTKSLGIMWGTMLDQGFTISAPAAEVVYGKDYNGSTKTMKGTLSTDVIARINALAAQGKAKIKANPRVATLEGKQAEISVTQDQYATIETGSQGNRYSTLETISSGVVLRITPYIDDKKHITVKIAPEVSEVVGQGSSGLPVINKRTAATTLRVDDGQTIAIGGLLQEQKTEQTRKTPFLGNLPIVGPALFNHKTSSLQNKEVIIMITPHIIEDSVLQKIAKMDEAFQASKQNPGVETEKDPVKLYYQKVNKIIEQNKQFPDSFKASLGPAPLEVSLEFTMFADGMVNSISIIKSSGNTLADENAIKTIQDLSPFPPFPAELKETYVTFVTVIRYEP